MPVEFDSKPKWGDIDEDDEAELPAASVKVENGIKTVIEYRINPDSGKKEKVTRQFKVGQTKRKIPRVVLLRRSWAKFGECRAEPPGPNPNNTSITDDVYLTLTSTKDDLDKDEEDALKTKIGQAKNVSCRICKGEHFTTKCPYKDNFQVPSTDEPTADAAAASAAGGKTGPGGKYVPPSMRDGGKRGEGARMGSRVTDDAATVRVTNLSEETRDSDLKELFSPFGTITRIFLAKDKNTQQSKGFAFVSYLRKEDAAKAIEGMNGRGHDYLILSVEWAKPSAN